MKTNNRKFKMNRLLLIALNIVFGLYISTLNAQDAEMGVELPANTNGPGEKVRILIVFAEVNWTPLADPYGTVSGWPAGSIPNWAGNLIDETYTTSPTNPITKYWHEMSMGNHKLIGDYLDQVITIPVADTNGRDNKAYQILNNLYASNSLTVNGGVPFDKTRYDLWDLSSGPGNPKLFAPDSKFDGLMLIWRNSRYFCNYCICPPMTTCPCGGNNPNPSQCGLALQSVGISAPFLGISGGISLRASFTSNSYYGNQEMMIAEYFHPLMGNNDAHTAGGAGNHTFLAPPASYGISAQSGGSSMVANGHERWFLGWEEPFQTLLIKGMVETLPGPVLSIVSTDLSQTTSSGGDYILRDFVTHGDAIRIELPYLNQESASVSKQFLWIENHQLKSDFDHSKGIGDPCKLDWEKGLQVYVQVDHEHKTGPNTYHGRGSYIMPRPAEGNYDYELGAMYSSSCVQYGNNTYPLNMDLSQPNPFTGHNDLYRKHNANGDAALTVPENLNTGGGKIIGGIFETHYHAWGDNKDAYNLTGKHEINMGTNPSTTPVYTQGYYVLGTTNYYHPIGAHDNRTIWLNGISIEILQENVYGSGEVKVRVRFDNYDVDDDTRWCGNIKLMPNYQNPANDALNLKSNKKITIDRGLSEQEITSTEIIGGDYVFTNPTEFTAISGAKIHMEDNSEIKVINKSTLRLKANSGIEIHDGAILRIGVNSKLICEDNSAIYVHNGGRVIIESTGYMYYGQGVQIILNGPNSVLEINGGLEIGPNADFTFTGNGNIEFGLPSIGAGASNITSTPTSTITLRGNSPSDLIVVVKDNTYVKPDIDNQKMTLNKGWIKMGKNAYINTSDGDFELTKLNVDALNPALPHGGFITNGQLNHLIENVEIHHATKGITGFQYFTDGAKLKMKDVTITQSGTGLQVYGKGAEMINVNFSGNQVGYNHSMPTFASSALQSSFNGNSLRGIHVVTGLGTLHLEDHNVQNNGLTGVYMLGVGSLSSVCGKIRNNPDGYHLATNATLRMDNTVKATGTYNKFTTNPVSIRLGYAKDVFLYNGKNELMSAPANLGNDIRGTMNKTCTAALSIKANKNHWNNRGTGCSGAIPVTGLDFSVTGLTCTINFDDPTLFCGPYLCNSIIVGGGGGGGSPMRNNPNDVTVDSPLENCPTCRVVYTQKTGQVALNIAVQTAITAYYSKEYKAALTTFKEILTSSLPQPDADEQYLLDMAYGYMLDSYSNGAEVVDQVTKQSYLSLVREAIVYQKSIATLTGSLSKKLSFQIDEALAYHVAGSYQGAIQTLQGFGYGQINELDQLATYYKCAISSEQKLVSGLITSAQFEAQIASCLPNNTARIGLTNSKEPKVEEDNTISVYPNPTEGKLNVKAVVADGTEVFSAIYDLTGRELLTATGAETELNLIELPTGIYILKVTTGEKTVTKKIMKE